MDEEQKKQMLNEAIEACKNEYNYEVGDRVVFTMAPDRQIDDPLEMDDMPGRTLVGMHTVGLFTDKILNHVEAFDMNAIKAACEARGINLY